MTERLDSLPKCKNGHPWKPETTYINKTSGARICKPCRQASQRRRRFIVGQWSPCLKERTWAH